MLLNATISLIEPSAYMPPWLISEDLLFELKLSNDSCSFIRRFDILKLLDFESVFRESDV